MWLRYLVFVLSLLVLLLVAAFLAHGEETILPQNWQSLKDSILTSKPYTMVSTNLLIMLLEWSSWAAEKLQTADERLEKSEAALLTTRDELNKYLELDKTRLLTIQEQGETIKSVSSTIDQKNLEIEILYGSITAVGVGLVVYGIYKGYFAIIGTGTVMVFTGGFHYVLKF